jgi:cell division protein ZapA
MKGVNVEIMGQSLTIASDGSDGGDQWIRAMAETVDEKIKRLRAGGQTVSSINLAILAALNFAEELERLKKEHHELIEAITAMNQRLTAAINGTDF